MDEKSLLLCNAARSLVDLLSIVLTFSLCIVYLH